MKIGFIGTGNMGGALIVAASKKVNKEELIITDYYLDKAKELADELDCRVAESNGELAETADFIVLAVKPNVILSVAEGISSVIKNRIAKGDIPVVVTIAAGVSIESLKGALGTTDVPVIRIMPNTPALIGKGMILIARDDVVSDKQYDSFKNAMSEAGDFQDIAESAINYTTAVSGCAPAYVYMFIEALADGAVQVGVPREQAIKLAAKTVLGSAAMVLETGEHPEKLKDDVCSPGGSTIVGVNTLEEHGFRNGVSQAIIKATEKNIELGKIKK